MFKSFKAEALKRQGVKEAYAELAPAYEVPRKLIALRQKAGYTQGQIAEKLLTSNSNTVP